MSAKSRIATLALIAAAFVVGRVSYDIVMVQSQESSAVRAPSQIMSAELVPGQPLRPRVHLTPDAARPQRFAVWSQATYAGRITPAIAEALMNEERAEALETMLTVSAGRELSKHLEAIDAQVVELGLQYDAEYVMAGQQLEECGGEHVLIRAKPHHTDTNWVHVKAMQDRVRMREGIIYSNLYRRGKDPQATARSDQPFVYAFLSWDRWPIVRRYKETFEALLTKRLLATRQWIGDQYRLRGFGLFQT